MFLLGAAALTPLASAQNDSAGFRVIAYEGDNATDGTGSPVPNLTFNAQPQSGNQSVFGEPMIDEEGGVMFTARLSENGTPLPPLVGIGMYYAGPDGQIQNLARTGDPVPALPGHTLGSLGMNPGHYGAIRHVGGGEALFYMDLGGSSSLFQGRAGALFSATPGTLDPLLPLGTVAPGTGGAVYDFLPTNLLEYPIGRTRSGDVWFVGYLDFGSGSPPVSSGVDGVDAIGLWAGPPDALELAARGLNPLPGLPDLIASGLASDIPKARAMNEAGQLLYELTLSTTLGSATNQDSSALLMYEVGTGNVLIARGGDPAPGFPDAVLVNAFGVTERSLTPSGDVFYVAALVQPPSSPSQTIAYRWNGSDHSILASAGELLPGTNGSTDVLEVIREVVPIGGENYVLRGRALEPTGFTYEALWHGTPDGLEPIVRGRSITTAGSLLPNGLGTTCVQLFSPGRVTFPLPSAFGSSLGALYTNDSGQVAFSCLQSGGLHGLYGWSEASGLRALIVPGTPVDLPDGSNRTVEQFYLPSLLSRTGTSSGASVALNDRGRLVARLHFTDGTTAIASLTLPERFQSYCLGEGSASQVCGVCPCDNRGVRGSGGGCMNSTGQSARLEGHGSGDIARDELRFSMSGALPGTIAILVSGDNQLPPGSPCPTGSGLPEFDGLRCMGGNLLRHGFRAIDVNGEVGALTREWGGSGSLVSVAAFASGQTRHFQALYRDLPHGACSAEQNTTNGVSVTFN